MTEFNLIDQPWVRVRWIDGELGEASLRDAFARAGEIRELAGELPTQDFAVLRVLLAVLYRALDAEESEDPLGDWQDLWDRPELPMLAIDDYLNRWRWRFDLFDPDQPFFQVSDLRTGKGATKPLELLVPDSDSLFPMRTRIDSLGAAEAARWVIHCHAYDISGIKSGAVGDSRVKAGKGSPIGIGWAGWLGGISAVGDTLRETLLLNLVLDRPRDERDLPIWEDPPLTAAQRDAVVVRGPLALLTWPQRRIRLFHKDGVVNSVLVCNGDPVAYTDLSDVELMSAWRYSEPQTKKLKRTVYMPWRFDPGVALWRGLRALLPLVRPKAGANAPFVTARILAWLGNLEAHGMLGAGQALRIRVSTVAYGSNNSAWEDIGADELAFDVRLASAESLAAQDLVRTALERSEVAAGIVGDLAGNLSLAAGGTRDQAYPAGRDAAYATLDTAFRFWLRNFDPGADLEAALSEWTEEVRSLCLELGAQMVVDAGPQAWKGRLVELNRKNVNLTTGLAETWFRRGLARELPKRALGEPRTLESEDA